MTLDLSRLPEPEILAPTTYEEILAAMRADLEGRMKARDAEFTALVESDPAVVVLEVAAYRESVLRQRVRDGIRAVMVAYATGSDLENLGALMGVEKKDGEPDDDLRQRIPGAFAGASPAGPRSAYRRHALAVKGVLDIDVTAPGHDTADSEALTEAELGKVNVHVLADTASGVPDQALLDAVAAALSAEDVRPLTDRVTVAAAEIVNYNVTGELTIQPGPDAMLVTAAAEAAVRDYTEGRSRLGIGVRRSGLIAALHVAGVEKVELTAPAADVDVTKSQSARLDVLTLTNA